VVCDYLFDKAVQDVISSIKIWIIEANCRPTTLMEINFSDKVASSGVIG
jgi:hypothetical protein